MNEEEIQKLDGEFKEFKYRYGYYGKKVTGTSKFDVAESNVLKLLQDVGAIGYTKDIQLKDIEPKHVQLKIGAQVMLSYNLDVSSGLVNGARGVIVRWGKTNKMRIDDGEEPKAVDLETAFSTKKDESFLYPDECLPIVKFACGRTIEVPYILQTMKKDGQEAYCWRIGLKLAWATSIHKSQSLTLDCAEIDISSCFETGMAYVALSRVSSLQLLRIAKEFAGSTFKVDQTVIDFYSTPFLIQKALFLNTEQKPAEPVPIDAGEVANFEIE
jgi:ATP-dependent DNA helicase PIF1